MNPLIYIPGQHPRTDETLKALGLGPMLDDSVSCMWADALGGTPDGQRGLLVFFDCPMATHTCSPRGINLEAQEWREAAKCGDLERGRFWIGWNRENPPTPEDLVRTDTTPGESIQLLDRNYWEIAVQSFVPHRRGIDLETGREVRRPQTAFKPFVDRCKELEEQFLSEDKDAIEIEGETIRMPGDFAFCSQALAINYRIVPDLVDALELVGDEELFHIVTAAIGIKTMAAIQREKKTT